MTDEQDEDTEARAVQARHSARYRRMLASFLSYAMDVKDIPAPTVVSGTMQGIADFIIVGLKKGTDDAALRELADVFFRMLVISRDENLEPEDDA